MGTCKVGTRTGASLALMRTITFGGLRAPRTALLLVLLLELLRAVVQQLSTSCSASVPSSWAAQACACSTRALSSSATARSSACLNAWPRPEDGGRLRTMPRRIRAATSAPPSSGRARKKELSCSASSLVRRSVSWSNGAGLWMGAGVWMSAPGRGSRAGGGNSKGDWPSCSRGIGIGGDSKCVRSRNPSRARLCHGRDSAGSSRCGADEEDGDAAPAVSSLLSSDEESVHDLRSCGEVAA